MRSGLSPILHLGETPCRCSQYRPTAPLPVRVCWRRGTGYRRTAGKFVRSGLHWDVYAGLVVDALERVRPVLGLLQPGIYVLSYSDCYPTDGDGHFFWDVPESLTSFKATSEYYDSDKHQSFPVSPAISILRRAHKSTILTRRRIIGGAPGRGRRLPPVSGPLIPAWGYMSVLLDGHHRACACELEEKTVPALTISRPGRIWREGILHIVWPDGSETPAADIITPAQQKLFDHCPLGRKRRGTPPLIASGVRPVWDMEYIKAAQRYPMYADAERWRCVPGTECGRASMSGDG